MDEKFPGKYDEWERGMTTPKPRPKGKPLLTSGAFCPDCKMVMIPSGGCFMCPCCGRGNAKCGG